MTGPDIHLQPQAIATMALVVHELVTNSCKHGALSGTGRVDVSVETTEGEGLHIRWKEVGEPAVLAPTRRGFGSVILEKTVPFDLQGTAKLRFLLEGLEAEFFIPQHYVFVGSHIPAAAASAPTSGNPNDAVATESELPLNGAAVLLVEDNMLIALEAEDMLRQARCRARGSSIDVERGGTAAEAARVPIRHARHKRRSGNHV